MRKALKWMLIGSLGIGFSAAAADAVVVKETTPGLLKMATVKADAAQSIALHEVPGTLKTAKVSDMDGAIVYSFEIASGSQNATVNVDSSNGRVLSVLKRDVNNPRIVTGQEYATPKYPGKPLQLHKK
ncbi:MAG: PepSY domain-containing protein [Myxococcaceae bacterium]